MYNIENVPLSAMMLYIVENIADVLKVKTFGFQSVVACSSLSEDDVKTLSKFNKLERIYIIHDKPKLIYDVLLSKYYVKYIIPQKPIRWLDKGEFNEIYYFQNRINKVSQVRYDDFLSHD